MRLDQELVIRGLARSRTQAARLVAEGRVKVSGVIARKPAMSVDTETDISADTEKWVSRAAHKLLGAIEESGTSMEGRVLDAGASTGGFTQVVLAQGAKLVYAVDVGHHQLADPIRSDPRVRVREGLNLRDLSLTDLDDQPVDVVVGDVSFISLKLLLPSLLKVLRPCGVALLLVKPQFEVGRERLGAGGVVRDTRLHAETVMAVSACARSHGLDVLAAIASPLPGPAGNVEYFLHMRAGSGQEPDGGLESAVRSAIATGPAGKEARK